MRGWLLFALALAAVATAATSAMLARSSDDTGNNVLTNGGFEAEPTEWQSVRADLTRVEAPVAEGTHAARLEVHFDRRDGYILRDVEAKPGGTYHFRGQIWLDDPDIREVRLTLGWTGPDGNLPETRSSFALHPGESSYRKLSTSAR